MLNALSLVTFPSSILLLIIGIQIFHKSKKFGGAIHIIFKKGNYVGPCSDRIIPLIQI